jgi:hypothetical protein
MKRIKWTYSTHRVDRSLAAGLAPLGEGPDPGRLVLARILVIGKHKDVEAVDGRRTALFPGDVIAGVLGYRYATDQFEGHAVASAPTGHLLGIGGVCGEVASKNEKMPDPTTVEWLGGLVDAHGRPLRLRSFALKPKQRSSSSRPRTLLVVGASMNSGKTTTAAQAIRSLSGQGRRVAAAKITGTACRKDIAIFEDAGAVRVLDFNDCGYPSTARLSREELLGVAADLRAVLLEERPDLIVVEIADGLFQRETRLLLEDPGFRKTVDVVLFTGVDSLSSEGGVRALRDLQYNVAAVSGLVANSRLGMEEVQAATGISCLNGEMILGGALAGALQPAQVA